MPETLNDVASLEEVVRGLSTTVEASGYLINRLEAVGVQLGRVVNDDRKAANGENSQGSLYGVLTQTADYAATNRTRLHRLVEDLERSVGISQAIATDSKSSSL